MPLKWYKARNGRLKSKDDNLSMFTGTHSLHKEFGDDGLRLVDFAISTNMMIGSTTFNHKDIQNVTCRSPEGRTQNEIDHD